MPTLYPQAGREETVFRAVCAPGKPGFFRFGLPVGRIHPVFVILPAGFPDVDL